MRSDHHAVPLGRGRLGEILEELFDLRGLRDVEVLVGAQGLFAADAVLAVELAQRPFGRAGLQEYQQAAVVQDVLRNGRSRVLDVFQEVGVEVPGPRQIHDHGLRRRVHGLAFRSRGVALAAPRGDDQRGTGRQCEAGYL